MLTRPALLLRLEGLALLAAALVLYGSGGYSWWIFAALVLLPDVFAVGYTRGPRVGAAAYNLAHTTTLPVALAVTGFLTGTGPLVLVGLVWLSHIGIDRALGYGLKLPTGFHDTHLGRIGRRRPAPSAVPGEQPRG